MTKMKVSFKGIDKLVSKYNKMSREISATPAQTLPEVAMQGEQFARFLAPVETGRTRDAIINFSESPETWLIVSGPPQDHPQFPINVFFDEGNFEIMNWRGRTSPKKSDSIGFFKKTATYLEQEFAKRLNLKIERIIR